MAVKRILF